MKTVIAFAALLLLAGCGGKEEAAWSDEPNRAITVALGQASAGGCAIYSATPDRKDRPSKWLVHCYEALPTGRAFTGEWVIYGHTGKAFGPFRVGEAKWDGPR